MEPMIDLNLAKEHGLSEEEYKSIIDILGRTPYTGQDSDLHRAGDIFGYVVGALFL
jgi:hypothetical protein